MKSPTVWMAGGAAALIAVILLVATRPPRREERSSAPPPGFDLGIPTAQEVRNMLGVYGERVETTERELKSLRGELETTRKALQEAVDTLKSDRRKESHLLESILRENPSKSAVSASGPRFRTFEFPRDASKRASLHLPAGSFGEATLLTGVYAPISGEALPVLLRLDAALVGPSKSRIPLRHALLVGKAQGDANSRRAVIQLDSLSVVDRSGRAIDAKVNGWVIDGDGVQGLNGAYVWRAGEVMALAAAGGGLSAGADALAQRETLTQATPLGGATQILTGDALRFAGLRGASGALSKLAEITTQRLQEVIPAIYVGNGKRVTVAFVSGATLEGMEP